ncbi:MAG: hypothetical protein AAFY46_13965, partial [Planctomycetota bacterium]
DSQTLDWFDWESDAAIGRRFPVRELLTNDQGISTTQVFVSGDPSVPSIATLDFLWDAVEVNGEGNLVVGGGEAAVPFRFQTDGVTPSANQDLPEITFPVGQRLLPDEASGGSPRYVWDVLARRVDIGIGEALEDDRSLVEVPLERLREFPVELMVIVRPVDRGIRVPAGLSLRDVLRGYRLEQQESGAINRVDLPDASRRFPVGAANNDGTSPRPGAGLDDNRLQYSIPVPIPAGRNLSEQFVRGNPALNIPKGTRLDITRDIAIERGGAVAFTLPTARRALSQVGQRFVSDTGIVHTVTRVFEPDLTEDGSSTIIEISPPLSTDFRQIVLTPQVPADIRVIRTR